MERDNPIVKALRMLAKGQSFNSPEVTVEGQAADYITRLLDAIEKHRDTIISLPGDDADTLLKHGHADARLWKVLHD
jgi:hypothetical protein